MSYLRQSVKQERETSAVDAQSKDVIRDAVSYLILFCSLGNELSLLLNFLQSLILVY